MELFITLTKGMGEPTYGLLLSHRVLAFEACSVRPTSKVLRIKGAAVSRFCSGYLGLVVRRLCCGKYIILCENRTQRALNGMCFS